MLYIVGQIFGILATICSIIASFFKKKWQMLINLMALNLFMMLNFILIGQFGSAACLCIVAVVQSMVSLVHNLKDTKVTFVETILFFILYVGFGIFGMVSAPGFVMEVSFANLLELLPISGAIMNMITVFVKGEQTTRKCILATSCIWMLYTGIIGATTFFSEFACAVTTVIAMYKYREKKA